MQLNVSILPLIVVRAMLKTTWGIDHLLIRAHTTGSVSKPRHKKRDPLI
ncbi:MAG: hypothetical protein QXI22_06545 [Sulfolobales archaeon]